MSSGRLDLKIALAVLLFTAAGVFFSPVSGQARTATNPAGHILLADTAKPATSDRAHTSSQQSKISLTNPLGQGTDIQTLVGRAASIFLGLSGSFALLMFVYGGFTWITSGGNPEKVKQGQQIFTWAVIGLVIMFSAYVVLKAIFTGLGLQ